MTVISVPFVVLEEGLMSSLQCIMNVPTDVRLSETSRLTYRIILFFGCRDIRTCT
jgi:hypothetical protein